MHKAKMSIEHQKNWRFEEWYNNTLKDNTIRCKKLATIVSGRKTSAKMQLNVRWCCISALVLNCFRLKKGRATFFDPKQLLRVSCILWCYYPKCYSIIVCAYFIHLSKVLKRRNGEDGVPLYSQIHINFKF